MIPVKKPVMTCTLDFGKEFAKHEIVSQVMLGEFYLTDPYRSRERGARENTNGLARQYFPKDVDFTAITDE